MSKSKEVEPFAVVLAIAVTACSVWSVLVIDRALYQLGVGMTDAVIVSTLLGGFIVGLYASHKAIDVLMVITGAEKRIPRVKKIKTKAVPASRCLPHLKS